MSQQPKKTYYNFGVGWYKDEFDVLSFVVDSTKNAKANKGQAYKLFLVPVDGTGDPVDEGIEIKYFNVKKNARDDRTPSSAPEYQVYASK